jgi:hypothetical protein
MTMCYMTYLGLCDSAVEFKSSSQVFIALFDDAARVSDCSVQR